MNTPYILPSELKFIIGSDTAVRIRDWARTELDADPCATEGDAYRTTSIYFDTDEFDTFFGRRSYGRAKYRIRRYNEADSVFLERKLKVTGRVAKRRSAVRLSDVWRTQAAGSSIERWFWRRVQHRRLAPVCRIAYKRTARVGMSSDGPLRLTIDHGIVAAPVIRFEFMDTPSVELLSGKAILELKYRSHVPLLFKRLIEQFSLQPQPASKYRLAVDAIGLAQEQNRVILHA